jgi:DNA-binding GntR family transcriptional regulator
MQISAMPRIAPELELRPLPPSDRIVDSVSETLREAILSGQVPPGAKLSVPLIAEQLGVSRSPVREAIARLSHQGIAQEEPRRGAIVARLGLKDLAALYEVRAALEGLAARLAVERKEPRLVSDLQKILASHEEAVSANDITAHAGADLDFHRRIRKSAQNGELFPIMEVIDSRVLLAMRTTCGPGAPQLALNDHRSVLEAIKSGDPDEAERRARTHVNRLRQVLLDASEHTSEAVGKRSDRLTSVR